MNTMVVFDSVGRCKYVLTGDSGSVDVSTEQAVVYTENTVDPNLVWYDYGAEKMLPRTPFPVTVSLNRIEGIPSGTTAYVGSDSAVIDTGVLELEVEYPEIVQVLLMHVRHVDKVVEVPCEVEG